MVHTVRDIRQIYNQLLIMNFTAQAWYQIRTIHL